MESPDLTGHAGAPGRGAFIILFLRVAEGRIAAAKYHTVGCGPTIACGSMLSELVVGRSIDECRGVTADDLIGALDGVPPDKLHCPALAIAALRDALRHWEPPGEF
jgi:nitrogen fixation NifU-like protein